MSRLLNELVALLGAPAPVKLQGVEAVVGVWSVADDFELLLVEASRASEASVRTLWTKRRGGRGVLLLAVVETPEGLVVCGPHGDPPQTWQTTADRGLVALVDRARATPGIFRVSLIEQAMEHLAGNLPGLRIHRYLSAHHVRRDLLYEPTPDHVAAGRTLLRLAENGPDGFKELGYDVESLDTRRSVLRLDDGQPIAVVHVYNEVTDFDRALDDGRLPAATLLQDTKMLGARFGLLFSRNRIRLHDSESFPATDSFVEFDLDMSSSEVASLAGRLFHESGLRPGGELDRTIERSRRFAVGLGEDLKRSIYNQAIPRLAQGIHEARSDAQRSEPGGVAETYRAALLLLFRFLFLAYAEAHEMLPVITSSRYREQSLTHFLDRVETTEAGEEEFSDRTDLWDDLQITFEAISRGNPEWRVPAYDGGLFDLETKQGAAPGSELLGRVRISNRHLGPAILALGTREDDGTKARLDYRDLDIRELGTIYEGLLQYRLTEASEPLRYDLASDSYQPVEERDAEILPGQVYVHTQAGGRKLQGAYYTPEPLVRRVVDESLRPAFQRHLKEVGDLEDDEASRALFEFAVLDPAMGSGHFLVDALDALAEMTTESLSTRPLPRVQREIDELRNRAEGEVSDQSLLRRIILRRMVYGVDVNPMAVELAKLALWLRALVPGLPLSYLDHNLQGGDSLLGVVGWEIEEAFAGTLLLEGVQTLTARAATRAGELRSLSEVALDDIDQARRRQAELEDLVRPLRRVYDLWVAGGLIEVEQADELDAAFASGSLSSKAYLESRRSKPRRNVDIRGLLVSLGGVDLFSDDLPIQLGAPKAIGDVYNDEVELGELPPLVDFAAEAAESFRFFHWALAFPEVFARGGFDVVVANPPWDKIKVERLTFYTLWIPGLKSISSDRDRNHEIERFLKHNPGVEDIYWEEVERVDELKWYFSKNAGNYRLHGGGDPDLFKAFAERFLHISREGGAVGAVLPRQLLSGNGTKDLRAVYLEENTLRVADVIVNAGHWAFEAVDVRLTIALVAVDRVPPEDGSRLAIAGPAHSLSVFEELPEQRITIPIADLRAWSDDLEIPLLKDQPQADLFAKLMSNTRFGDDHDGWVARPYRELDASNDKHLFNEDGVGWPVYKGETFYQYEIDGPHTYWLDPEVGLAHLQEKRLNAHSAFEGFSQEWLEDPGSLPPLNPRIAFRDVARANDSRTVIAALLPARVFAQSDCPTLLWPSGGTSDRLSYLIGIFNSLPFDYAARRRVEQHLKYYILNRLPVPEPESPIRALIMQTAARLSAKDERFADFAEEIGVEYGPLDKLQKTELRAEIDALVAHAYRLTEDELELIFTDFTWDAVPEDYRQRVRDFYGAHV